MGMTNRVIPAQGEERGASFTLIGLDGDTARKFQPFQQQFIWKFLQCALRHQATVRRPDLGLILP